MRWRGMRRSSNVDDQRGSSAGRGMRLPIGGKGGFGLVMLLLIAYFVGGPELVMNLLGSGGDVQRPSAAGTEVSQSGQVAPSDEAGELASTMLGSTEDVWGAIFAERGSSYVPPRLVLFSDAVQSACGYNTSATGPFYWPPDQRLYLDTGFFHDLARMGGPGDFAQAYVIGHEVGHHVQSLIGTADQVRRGQQSDQRRANQLQVALELQADCYAGVWAYHANQSQNQAFLEPGDVQEGLAAAAAIGDDRLQQSAGRSVSPESFTHGSSAERQRWLEIGLTTGDIEACNTFAAR
jgi:uncharacterized protein